MKTLKSFFALLLFVSLFSTQIFSQWVDNTEATQFDNGVSLYFNLVVDSTDTYNSEAFTLSKYDNDLWTTYPMSYSRIITSTLGTPYVTCLVQYSPVEATASTYWTTIDTLFLKDSIETFASGTFNLNDSKKPYYRLRFVGDANGALTNNRSDSNTKVWLYIGRKDY